MLQKTGTQSIERLAGILAGRSSLKQAGRMALGAVFPPICPLSGERLSQDSACAPRSWRELPFLSGPVCCSCAMKLPDIYAADKRCDACHAAPRNFDSAGAAFLYAEPITELILRFKHGDATYLTPFLVKHLCFAWRRGNALRQHINRITSVPLHPRRVLERGYDQAHLLAHGFAKRMQKNAHPDKGTYASLSLARGAYAPLSLVRGAYAPLLKRTRHSPPQGNKSVQARIANVGNAFAPLGPQALQSIKNAHILLIDDVMTTGATADACAGVLKQAGAASVHVLVLARVISHSG